MSKFAFAMAAAAFGALAGCGPQASTPLAQAPAEQAAITPPAPIVNLTQSFLDRAAQTDTLEITISKAALTKSTNADVKALAAMLIKDHTATTKQLRAWSADNAGFTLPAALTADFQARSDNVINADAAGFDDKYLDTVIDAHEAAIAAFKDYLDAGDHDSLKAWAKQTLPTLTAHFEKASSLRDAINKV